VHLIVPLHQHANASQSALVVVWQDPTTLDAVLAASVGFIACIGQTGAAFADLFETEAAARAALREHRARGFMQPPE
jgi:hypothetical protein